MSLSAINQPAAALDHYRALFASRNVPDDALGKLRRASLERFLAGGFPTQRDEAWKYTSLRRVESRRFAPADAMPIGADESQWIADAGHRLVLVNGRYMPTLSTPAPQPPGVTILTLAQWASHSPTQVADFLARHDHAAPHATPPTANGAFEHLNGAFSDDGVVIDIAPNVQFEQPIYLVHQWCMPASARSAGSHMANPRIIVRAGAHSECSIITHWVGDETAESLTNAWLTFDLGVGARVSHLNLQEEPSRSFHIETTRLQLAANAHFGKHDFALGSALGRSGTLVTLGGPGANVSLNGLFAPTGTQHLDTYVHIDHAAAHTTSQQDFRGIAAGRGRGIFNGKVVVQPGAQKIDARQSNRNLLLSNTAEIDSRPELEIYAHDVKCSHGATTGQLDPVSLFYLRSRGLGESEARALLIRAFAQSMLSTVQVGAVREWLEARVQRRFDLSAGDHS